MVESTGELEERARSHGLEHFDDQDLSFTDAVSFAVMSERRIRKALALGHHFAVAGFEVVPGASERKRSSSPHRRREAAPHGLEQCTVTEGRQEG